MGRVREEKRRRKRIKEETIRRKKIQVREKVRVAKRCVFPMVRGSGGSNSIATATAVAATTAAATTAATTTAAAATAATTTMLYFYSCFDCSTLFWFRWYQHEATILPGRG